MPVTDPAEIRTLLPGPRYRCEGADSHAPDVCESVHFRDEDAGYLEARDLFYIQASHEDQEWSGFFCVPCADRIETVNTSCSQCGNTSGFFERSQVTLQELMDHPAAPSKQPAGA